MMFNFAISLYLHYKIHVSINNITPTASYLPFSYGFLNDLIRKKTSFKTFLKPLSAYCEKNDGSYISGTQLGDLLAVIF